MDVDFYESVFAWKSHLLGMDFVEMLAREPEAARVQPFVLLGDPALRVGYRESTREKWDLAVKSDAGFIWFDPPIDAIPCPDETRLKAAVVNVTNVPLSFGDTIGVSVEFFMRSSDAEWDLLGMDTVRTAGPWDSATVEVPFSPRDYPLGTYDFLVKIDPDGEFEDYEAYRENNEAQITKELGLWRSGYPFALPSTPSDQPTLAYLRSPSGSWEHFTLFPCENSGLYGVPARFAHRALVTEP